MTWTVRIDPAAVAVARAELDLNNGPIQVDQQGIDWGDAAITAFMANEQRWGSSVISYRVPNRQVVLPLFLGVSGNAETARAQLTQKVAQFQREGGILLRQRGSGPPMYADIQNASLTMPDKWGETGGVEEGLKLTLECLPDFYGNLVTLDTLNVTAESAAVLLQGGAQAAILGDHPGRAQLTVMDSSGNQQFGFLWGFRARRYDPAASAKLIWIATSDLTPAAGAASGALTGAHGGNALVKAGVGTAWTDLAYLTGSHVGSYQVWARCSSPGAGQSFRFAWNMGDRFHGLILNDQKTLPAANGLYLLNLGQVRFDPTPIGNQQWAGVVQTISAAGAQTPAIDALFLQPLDESAGNAMGSTVNSDPVILNNGRLNLRWDGVSRSIAGGAVFPPVGLPGGDLPRIPPSGLEGRAVQLFTKPSRGDLQTAADSGLDAYSVQVSYRPSYIHRP